MRAARNPRQGCAVRALVEVVKALVVVDDRAVSLVAAGAGVPKAVALVAVVAREAQAVAAASSG